MLLLERCCFSDSVGHLFATGLDYVAIIFVVIVPEEAITRVLNRQCV